MAFEDAQTRNRVQAVFAALDITISNHELPRVMEVLELFNEIVNRKELQNS